MKINLHSSTDEAQVQIVPLIDVIFCILTFFLLAALQFTRQQAINIDLPKATSGTSATLNTQASRDILPVTIDALGQTYVEKQQIDKTRLEATLRDYLQKNPKGLLVLNASRSATYNDVIEILDLLRQVGGDRVSLGIIPGPDQGANPTTPTQPGLTNPGFPNQQLPPGGNIPGISPFPGVPPADNSAPQPNNPSSAAPPAPKPSP